MGRHVYLAQLVPMSVYDLSSIKVVDAVFIGRYADYGS